MVVGGITCAFLAGRDPWVTAARLAYVALVVGAIASVAMLLRHSLELDEEATAVETAIRTVIDAGARTADLAGAGDAVLTTTEMTEAIRRELD